VIQLLIDNPLLLLFVVAAIGYPLGRIKLAGSSLGVAAVLFVGIVIGSLHPDLKLPDIFYNLGLVLFVYTVGLSYGPMFFATFQQKGLRDNAVVIAILCGAAGLAAIAHALLQLKASMAVGMFVGSMNNTAALAGVLEYIKTYIPAASRDVMLSESAIGFSITFPMGVIGTILAISLAQRLWKINYAREAQAVQDPGAGGVTQQLITRTIRVTNPPENGQSIKELVRANRWNVLFGRIKRDGEIQLVNGAEHLQNNDLASVVGTAEDLNKVKDALGEMAEERLDWIAA